MKLKRPKRTDKKLSEMIILRLKEIRNNHGHSQEYVQTNTEIDISHIEIGRVTPSVVSLSIFCKFYGMTLDEFFAPMKYPTKE